MQLPPLKLQIEAPDDWQDALHRFGLPLQCGPREASGLRGSALFARLHGSTVAEIRLDAARISRRVIEGPDDAPQALVVWQLAGRSAVDQAPHRATLEAGMWAMFDPAREHVLDIERGSRILLLQVPQAQCPGWIGALGAVAALALPAGGPAHIASVALASMLRDGVRLDEESERTLHASIVALVDGALATELRQRDVAAPEGAPSRLSQVQAYVLGRLADHGLTVDRVATAFGMSRRSLYNVFVSAGLTPHAFIQNARLDHACALLRHPQWSGAPVARIARQSGFTDPAHFSRAFHARHGVAPTTWREGAI